MQMERVGRMPVSVGKPLFIERKTSRRLDHRQLPQRPTDISCSRIHGLYLFFTTIIETIQLLIVMRNV